ncbi:hypothetical protein LJ739_17865 [Aestuariibacter halophilus]|uniref:Uncharacterized protein n=1 Tax=Fluctibacter halophilus TaxID=226011 RepID=A0ABS8GC25_9ALTE|nr:DUF6640 family protein [Aestuariibacter halophilus]MCC2618127.1 hypothetical protein [Aestuariibacter halophilus]
MKAPLSSKVMITIGVFFYLVVIPYLETNQSHVFNQTWPPHARFHEVWQLFTHCALGIVALWLTWHRQAIAMAATLSTCIMGGVLVAHAMSGEYGGSVQSGNLSKQVLGMELAVFVALVVVLLSLTAAFIARSRLG